jgi:hypothetical protein
VANASALASASGNAIALAQALAMASPAASYCGVQSQFTDGIGGFSLPGGLPNTDFGHRHAAK